MIKAILFDLDNTLTDTVSIKLKCIKQSIKKMTKAGLKMSHEQAFELLMKVYKKSDYESSTIFQDFLIQAIGKIDYKILSAGIVEYRKVRFNYVKPYPEIKQVLNKLQKYDDLIIGILTDSPKVKAWIRLTSIKLVDYFDLILTYEDVNEKKPHHKGFKKAIKMLKLNPNEILFVGDVPHKDIKGAKEVGMKTALAKYGQFLKGNEKPDYILKTPKDLLEIIKNDRR